MWRQDLTPEAPKGAPLRGRTEHSGQEKTLNCSMWNVLDGILSKWNLGKKSYQDQNWFSCEEPQGMEANATGLQMENTLTCAGEERKWEASKDELFPTP